MVADPHGDHAIRSPLVVGSSVVGELWVIPEPRHAATADERALLAGLADMAAIAIHNTRLLDRERQVAVLEERDHLAREMHDTLAQVLGYLHLKAASTRKRLASGEVERAAEELQEMQDLAHEAYVDVREAILGLRETLAPAGGLSAACASTSRSSGANPALTYAWWQPMALRRRSHPRPRSSCCASCKKPSPTCVSMRRLQARP